MNNKISSDALDKIKAIILKLLMDNNGYAKREFSSSELEQLSRQMANGLQINQYEIQNKFFHPIPKCCESSIIF